MNAGVTPAEADAALVPTALVAVTEQVYAVPLARPVTVSGEAGPDAENPPGLQVAVYEVMGDPPSLAGAVNATVACALPGVAVPIVGAPGTVAGVTLFDAAEAGPVPSAFVAVTVNVYAVPFASPVTGIEVHGAAQVPVIAPGEEVAV